jgi:hypothetical protein
MLRVLCLRICRSCCSCFASFLVSLHGYIEETPPMAVVGNICSASQVHKHMHRLWGSLLYILRFYSHYLFCSI